MFVVDCHTVALLLGFASGAKSPQNKPRAQACLAKRHTRKQCCHECVGGLRAQAQSQERKAQNEAKKG